MAGLSEEQIALLEEEIEKVRRLATDLEGLRDARGATFDRAVARAVEAGLEQASLEAFFRKLAEGVKRAFSRASGESRAGAIERITGNITQAASFALRLAQAWRSAETDLGRVVAVAAQIEGPIGQVAQAIQAIDAIFGGRLLGTRYQTIGERRILSLTPMGIEGTQITIQERQRSLFRGRRRRELSAGLDAEAAAQLQRLFDEVERAIGSAAAAVGVRAPVIVSGRIEQEWDKDRRLVRSVSTVLGRTYTEAVEDFTRRITAESIFATLGAVLGDGVEALAERFRASAADLLDAAQTLVRIQTDIRFGTGLLRGEGDAFRVFEVVEVLARVGETLEQAYQRLAAAASALESGMSGLGIMVERGRDAFVAFAGALADSVGGAQELARLLDSAASLTDPLARAFGQMELARRRAEEALAAAGLADQEALLAELREALLAGDAELAASLLRVADAVRQARDATLAYEQALEAQRERLAGYAREVGALELELFMSGLSASQAEIAQARLQYQQMVESLHAAARAAGMAGARTEDLARAQELYARRLQADCGAAAGRRRWHSSASLASVRLAVSSAKSRRCRRKRRRPHRLSAPRAQAWRAAAEEAASAADLLRIGDLSPLSYEQRLEAALRLFRASAERAARAAGARARPGAVRGGRGVRRDLRRGRGRAAADGRHGGRADRRGGLRGHRRGDGRPSGGSAGAVDRRTRPAWRSSSRRSSVRRVRRSWWVSSQASQRSLGRASARSSRASASPSPTSLKCLACRQRRSSGSSSRGWGLRSRRSMPSRRRPTRWWRRCCVCRTRRRSPCGTVSRGPSPASLTSRRRAIAVRRSGTSRRWTV